MRIAPLAALAAALALPPAVAQVGTATPAASPSAAPATAPAAAPIRTGPPVAPVREVRETIHGVEVVDPYRWMEEAASAETRAFLEAQDAHARAQLSRLPGREALLARIRELSAATVAISSLSMANGKVFYLKLAPGRATPVLCVRDGFAGAERVLVDPSKFDAAPRRAAISWYHASPDGRRVAYGVALAGTEDATLRVLEVAGAKDDGIAIERARFNAQMGWHHDGNAFYYARIPEGQRDVSKRNAGLRVYRHVVGRPATQDEIVFASGVGGARDVPEFVYPSILVPEESNYAYAIARHGVAREIAVYQSPVKDLAAGIPRWRRIVAYEDGVTAITAWKDDVYLLTHKGAPRHKVIALKASSPEIAKAKVIVPQGDSVIVSMALAADALYLRTTVGGLERLERLNFGVAASKTPEFVKTAFDVAMAQIVTHPRRPGAVLRTQGFIEAPAVIAVEARTGNLKNTGLQPPPAADFGAMDEVRLYAKSHDGVKIPVTLLYRKTTMLSADNPTLLIGYGAYGISMSPSFDPTRLAWLERGGIIAIAHLRGGGEYGEEWHRGGQKATKQNTILDFIAVAEFLIQYGFTTPRHLAIQGTSAGGIPSGGAMVRRPDLFAAVVPRVAVLDMLRTEFSQNGPANIPEFGSVATREGFDALFGMSAYHWVKNGTDYPAVLLTTGLNDPRVDPWQAAKMAARLQAANPGGRPVLLRVERDGGHGQGSTRAQREEELADIYSFLLWRFGVPDFQPVP
jgi:prolyl oligopeptidase